MAMWSTSVFYSEIERSFTDNKYVKFVGVVIARKVTLLKTVFDLLDTEVVSMLDSRWDGQYDLMYMSHKLCSQDTVAIQML